MPILPKKTLLAIASLQGFALYALYYAFDTKSWPSESPIWSFPLWTLALAVPLILLLSLTTTNQARVYRYVALVAALFAGLAIYVGFQAQPVDEFRISSLVTSFVLTMTLAAFKALMYLQQRADQVALTYPVLFTHSWRNFLVGVLSAIFVFVFFWILMLWGQLFKVIDIDFFRKLFQKEWFLFPTLAIAFGIGVIIFRDLSNVIDSITRLLHWLCKLLLPLVVGVGTLFLVALPFVGLDVLWATGNGTALLLWLLALTLFFVNAVYQDGRETNPYPAIVHRAIYTGLCLMPVLSVLSFYGLYLRLAQYGWTVERCWAFVTWLVLTLFALGYVIGIARKRSQWTADLARVNIHMGWVILGIMLLANSPLLDFRKISLASQLSRVDSGEVELIDFDFWYTERHLARPGHLAKERIKLDVGDNAELLAVIESPVNHRYGRGVSARKNFWEDLKFRPEEFEVSKELRIRIDAESHYPDGAERTLIRVDLDENGTSEYVLVGVLDDFVAQARLFYYRDGQWHSDHMNVTNRNNVSDVQDGEISLETRRYKNLKLGDIEFQPYNIQ